MRKFLVSLAAAGMFLAAQTAFADTATGVIEGVDGENGIITLEDGSAYLAPEDMDLGGLEAGTKVEIEFEADGDDNNITDITITE